MVPRERNCSYGGGPVDDLIPKIIKMYLSASFHEVLYEVHFQDDSPEYVFFKTEMRYITCFQH
jgi:hypothetical protein